MKMDRMQAIKNIPPHMWSRKIEIEREREMDKKKWDRAMCKPREKEMLWTKICREIRAKNPFTHTYYAVVVIDVVDRAPLNYHSAPTSPHTAPNALRVIGNLDSKRCDKWKQTMHTKWKLPECFIPVGVWECAVHIVSILRVYERWKVQRWQRKRDFNNKNNWNISV